MTPLKAIVRELAMRDAYEGICFNVDIDDRSDAWRLTAYRSGRSARTDLSGRTVSILRNQKGAMIAWLVENMDYVARLVREPLRPAFRIGTRNHAKRLVA